MEKICDAWKLKTYALTQDYFKRIQGVREEN